MNAHSRSSELKNDPGLAGWLGALTLAALFELAILRLFTRTAIHIPALEELQRPYAWLSDGGRYAYFAAIALLIPGLVWLTFELRNISFGAFTGALLFAAGAGLAAAGVTQPAVVDLTTLGAVVLLGLSLSRFDDWRATISPAFFVASFAAMGVYASLPTFGEGQPEWLLQFSEFAGVGFALSAPLLLGGPPTSLAVKLGGGGAAIVLLAFLGNGSTARFLLLWNIGLAGSLPAVAYAAAGGALLATIVGLMQTQRRTEALALILLICGGIGLHSTYQSGLVVVGLATLCWARRSSRPVAIEAPVVQEFPMPAVALR
ncbi:MAG: hypothetical protein AB7J35_15310 [Dehalococcoidia bacterium]